MSDERCPYAHGELVVKGPRVEGRHGLDKEGRTYSSIMICPICDKYFAVTGIREIVEVQAV